LVLLGHAGQAADKKSLLCERLHHSACTVHPRDRVQHALTSIRDDSLSLVAIASSPNRHRSPHSNRKTDLASLQRTRNDVLQNLDKLPFGNLSLHVHAKASINVPLGGHHLSLAPFILADDFRLIRNDDLGIHDDWKVQRKKFSQQTRICGIRRLLK